MKITLFTALLLMSTMAFAEITGIFKISIVAVNPAGNLPFRVYGMPTVPSCPGGNFAYVDENDPTANAKISTLLMAFSTGKPVSLQVWPVSNPTLGNTFCQISVVSVAQ